MTPERRFDWRFAALAALLPAIVYSLTLCPTAYHDFDSAEFAKFVPRAGIPHQPGYPLYMVTTRAIMALVPGEPARGVNAASAVAGVLGAVAMLALVWRLTGSYRAGLIAAWTLAFSFTHWTLSTVAEVYVLQAALQVGAMAALAWGAPRAGALLMGLGFANHPSSVLIAFPVLLGVLLEKETRDEMVRRWRSVVALFCLPGLLYLYLPLASRFSADPGLWLREFHRDLTKPADLWWYLSLQGYPPLLYKYELDYMLKEAGFTLSCFVNDFGPAGAALSLVGLLLLQRRRPAVGLTVFLCCALQLGFYAGFTPDDKFTMFCPSFALLATGVGVAAAELLARAGSRAGLVFVVLLALPASLLVQHHAAVDKSGYTASADYARPALARVEAGATIWGGWQASSVLDYFATFEKPELRLDIRCYSARLSYIGTERGFPIGDQRTRWVLASEMLAQVRAGRPVYAAFGSPELVAHFKREPAGLLYRLRPRDPPRFLSQPPADWPTRPLAVAPGCELLQLAPRPQPARQGEIVRLHFRWRITSPAAFDQLVFLSVHDPATDAQLELGLTRQPYQIHGVGMFRGKDAAGPYMEELLDFTLSPELSGTALAAGEHVLKVRVGGQGLAVEAARLRVLDSAAPDRP